MNRICHDFVLQLRENVSKLKGKKDWPSHSMIFRSFKLVNGLGYTLLQFGQLFAPFCSSRKWGKLGRLLTEWSDTCVRILLYVYSGTYKYCSLITIFACFKVAASTKWLGLKKSKIIKFLLVMASKNDQNSCKSVERYVGKNGLVKLQKALMKYTSISNDSDIPHFFVCKACSIEICSNSTESVLSASFA